MEFANATMQLRPGMYAEVELQSGGESALAIPREAMMDGGEIVYAFVVTNGTRFEPRRIEIGRRSDDWVEVTSGLRENETVVTSANFLIDSESRLQAAITGMGNTQADPHAGHGK
jgi:multidrug efflux pump subunit AcrA (membrane-fusion protein)